MDGVCILKIIPEQGCLVPAPGAGDTASPRAQRWVWGGCRLTQGTLSSGGCGEEGSQWDPRGDPELQLLPWERQCQKLSLEKAQQQREGDLCWGQPLPPLGCGKAEERGKMGCRVLRGHVPGGGWFPDSSVPRR